MEHSEQSEQSEESGKKGKLLDIDKEALKRLSIQAIEKGFNSLKAYCEFILEETSKLNVKK